jgi:transposase
MPAPMSLDPRLRTVCAVEQGSSIREAARRFAVSQSAIKLIQRVRATGSAALARRGGHRRPLLAPHESDLSRLVEARPDSTLAELQPQLERRFGWSPVSRRAPRHSAGSACGTKKVAEGGRTGSPPCRRQAPALARLAALHDPARFVVPRRDGHRHQHDGPLWALFVGPAPGRGRAARPPAHHHVRRRAAPERHRPAAGAGWLHDRDGVSGLRRAALVPALESGDVMVFDNRAAHNVDGVRQAIAAAGASLLYLPHYSPDLNPIEQLFAKLKALLRKAAARTKTSSGRPSAASCEPGRLPSAPAISPLRLWCHLR